MLNVREKIFLIELEVSRYDYMREEKNISAAQSYVSYTDIFLVYALFLCYTGQLSNG